MLLTGFRGFSRGTRREMRNKAWPGKATTHIDPRGRFRFLEKNITIELKRYLFKYTVYKYHDIF